MNLEEDPESLQSARELLHTGTERTAAVLAGLHPHLDTLKPNKHVKNNTHALYSQCCTLL